MLPPKSDQTDDSECRKPMLNTQSPIPLYHQLADILMARIRSGEYPAGDRIPAELKLAESYNIGRPTVRQAIELLVSKGILERRRGSGTFVRERKAEVDLFSLDGTSSSFRKKGLAVTRRMLKKIRLKTVRGEAENPFNGGRAYFFSRLTKVENEPVLIEDLYLHPDLFPGIDEVDLADRSLSEIAEERYYLKPTSGRQTFRIGYADDGRAGDLGVSRSTPILIVNRYLHFTQAENAVCSALYCRTDRYVFSQTLGGASHG
jgi:GntR family transcriptional regulator